MVLTRTLAARYQRFSRLACGGSKAFFHKGRELLTPVNSRPKTHNPFCLQGLNEISMTKFGFLHVP